MDKKELKKAREDFSLHTALLTRAGHSKAVAMAIAYAEGPDELAKRLGEQGLLPSMGVAPATADPKLKAV